MSRISKIMLERRCSYTEAKRIAEQEAQGSFAAPAGYAAFYDRQSLRIYLRVPQRPELGEPGCCEYGLDHATALRLRDELNDALLMRPPNDKVSHTAGRTTENV